MLPPNFHLTGPNIKPNSDDMIAQLKAKDPNIFEFLEDARAANQKIIFITIGTECCW